MPLASLLTGGVQGGLTGGSATATGGTSGGIGSSGGISSPITIGGFKTAGGAGVTVPAWLYWAAVIAVGGGALWMLRKRR